MILEDATHEAYGYYPSSLKPRSGKRILAVCDICGEFRAIRKDGYHSLCVSCSQKGKTLSEDHKRKISEAKKGVFEGDKNSNWKGGEVKRICKVCGKTFFVKPNIVKRGEGIYCSRSCRMKAQRHNAKPEKTAPERIFEAICIKNDLPFTFVGNGSLWLGNANPDFVHNTKKIVVEVFGNYWHDPLINRNIRYTGTVEGRTAQLKAEGYKTIILWETDLMREDAESFILHEMHNRCII